MAKRKRGSKVQKRAKPRRGNSGKRSKARKVAKSAKGKAPKRTIATAKPKRATVKKPAQKEVRPSAVVAEAVVVEKTSPDAIIIVPESLDPAA
jgi:hypothetical protein